MNKNKKSSVDASHYSVIIQWSEEDRVYVVTLPEWGGCHTHGSTYEEAAKNAREVLEMLIETERQEGRELPPPHGFMFPGPSGFTYELHSHSSARKVRHATA
jgi:antitoxin HicB